MNILITGGAGFIGSHLLVALLGEGHNVRIVDNLSTGRIQNLGNARNFEFIHGDLEDPEIAAKSVSNIEIVLHHAAISSVSSSLTDPMQTHRANVAATLTLLLACRNAGVRRLIYAGSASAYGNSPELPKVETMRCDPQSFYALQKLTGEQYCLLFTTLYGLETVILRYFNVFGPQQDPESSYSSVIPLFIQSMLRGRQIMINGDGSQSRDFIYVSDIVQANFKAMITRDIAGEVFNIGCGSCHSLLELIDILEDITGRRCQITHTYPRPGDILHSVALIEKARDQLGFAPAVTFREGLKLTLDWIRAKLPSRVSAQASG